MKTQKKAVIFFVLGVLFVLSSEDWSEELQNSGRTGHKVKVTPVGFCSTLLIANGKRESAPKTEVDGDEKLLFCFVFYLA